MIVDVAVVGAGFSGLMAGLTATRAGKSAVILERKQTAGGLVQSQQIGGVRIDAGADSFSIASPEFEEFVHRIGLEDRLIRPNPKPAVIVSPSGKHPIPRGVFGVPADLGDPALSFMRAEDLSYAHVLDSQPIPQNLDLMSVKDLIDSRLGPAFTELLVGPIMSGVHGSPAVDLEASTVLRELVNKFRETGSLVHAASDLRALKPAPGAAVASISGGMHVLIESLANIFRQTGGIVKLGTGVHRIHRDSHGLFTLDADDAITAREVVIATSAPAAAVILRDFSDLATLLSEFESVKTSTITALVEDETLNDFPVGSGALVAAGMGTRVKATTHLNAKWNWIGDALEKNQHLIRFSLGSGATLTREEYEHELATAFPLVYGASHPTVLESVQTVWNDSLVKASSGHASRVGRVRQLANDSGIELRGSYLAGNGLLGIAKNEISMMEGKTK